MGKSVAFSDVVKSFINVHPRIKTLTASVNSFVKSPQIVMPDLIRHPEAIEITGFRLSPE
jgi:hypothetical protein